MELIVELRGHQHIFPVCGRAADQIEAEKRYTVQLECAITTLRQQVDTQKSLLREMGEALEGVVIAHGYEGGTPVNALTKYKEITNGN